jgi:hypothetical protein
MDNYDSAEIAKSAHSQLTRSLVYQEQQWQGNTGQLKYQLWLQYTYGAVFNTSTSLIERTCSRKYQQNISPLTQLSHIAKRLFNNTVE